MGVLGRAAWSERTIQLSRLAVHVREWPAPAPPLLLLHGLGVDSTVWQAIGRRLHPTFSLLAPDLRGHGYSAHPAAGYAAQDYAADIAALLDALAGEYGVLHVLGHSLGGLAALGAAALNRDAVGRLILEDPPLHGPGPLAPYLAAVLAAKQFGGNILRTVLQFQPDLGELIGRVQAAMWERTADGALRAILDHPDTVFDINGWLGLVTAPTLLMTADPARDGRLGPQQAAAAVAALRDGRLLSFPDTGHVIHGQRPAEFCRAITAFLEV